MKKIIFGVFVLSLVLPSLSLAAMNIKNRNMDGEMRAKGVKSEKGLGVSANSSCIQQAIDTRETAVISAFSKFSTSMINALNKRKSAYSEAASKTNPADKKTAMKSAIETFKKERSSAGATYKSEKKSAWENFKNTLTNTCKLPNAAKEEKEKDSIDPIM